ncbi:MAG: hypothetical protein PHX21_12935 [bacterium]|nr:hypothetical protein [bacterium]
MTGLLVGAGLIWLFVQAKKNAQKPATLPGNLSPNYITVPEVVVAEGVVKDRSKFSQGATNMSSGITTYNATAPQIMYTTIQSKTPGAPPSFLEIGNTIVGENYTMSGTVKNGSLNPATAPILGYIIKGKMAKLLPMPTSSGWVNDPSKIRTL